jgi:hypothetical protein
MDIKALEREIELLKELIELKEKLAQLENVPACPWHYPYIPYYTHPHTYTPYRWSSTCAGITGASKSMSGSI